MREIKPGDEVTIRDARGKTLRRRALSTVILERDFPVVRACREEEWHASQGEGGEPDGVPWPAEDVEPLDP